MVQVVEKQLVEAQRVKEQEVRFQYRLKEERYLLSKDFLLDVVKEEIKFLRKTTPRVLKTTGDACAGAGG
jgi:hypothetical protein